LADFDVRLLHGAELAPRGAGQLKSVPVPQNARPEQERHNLLADPKKGTCARSVHMDSFAAVPETYHERLKPAKRTCKERRAESIEQ
jgi:hypothetical protein